MATDRVRVFIQSSLVPLTQVFPTIKGEFEYKRESGKVYYKHEAKDKFKFTTTEDYNLIKPHFDNECEEISIIVEKKCEGEFTVYWEGVFKMFDATDNRDKCFITVKVKPLDAYKCFEEKIDEEQNVFSSGSIVTTKSLAGEIEEKTCFELNNDATCSDYYNALGNPLDDCLTDGVENWCLKENYVELDGISGTYSCSGSTSHVVTQETTWHREILVTDCVGGEPSYPTFTLSDEWELLGDNCSSDGTATWWRCPFTAGGVLLGDYTRGRTFAAFLSRIISNMDCDLVIKSDFFGINPLGDAPANEAYTFASNYCQNITVHQKSDIKLPDVVNGSTSASWVLTPQDFFEDLKKIFNVDYVIEDGVFILEHNSFFTSSLGMDLQDEKMPFTLEYGTAENVKQENFYWPENVSVAFRSKPITYDCGENVKDQRCVLLHTDLSYIQNEGNAENVADEGFVLISNGVVGGEYFIIDGNSPFKWTRLQEKLHQHDRLYRSGSINGVSQTFLSWQPYITQEKFSVYRCCADNSFAPDDLVTTKLGVAAVEQANYNVYTDKLELELKY